MRVYNLRAVAIVHLIAILCVMEGCVDNTTTIESTIGNDWLAKIIRSDGNTSIARFDASVNDYIQKEKLVWTDIKSMFRTTCPSESECTTNRYYTYGQIGVLDESKIGIFCWIVRFQKEKENIHVSVDSNLMQFSNAKCKKD